MQTASTTSHSRVLRSRVLRSRTVRSMALVGALALAALGVACNGDDDADASPTVTATATATAEATGTAPADGTPASPGEADASLAAYSAIVEDVTVAFPGVTLIEDTGSFEVRSLVGEGRRVLLYGTAAELPTFGEIQQMLRGILEGDGWVEDFQFAADGPTGTLSVWEKGEDTAILSADVAPQDPSVCPPDQIIWECLDALDPSEIDVQGSITVAFRDE